MTIARTAFNVATLPTAVLPLAKQHLRVDWSYDDAFIESVIARAIARFEAQNGVSLNPATFEWKPGASDFCSDRARLPVTPVKSFTALDGAAIDVTSSYSITTDSTYGVPILWFNGAHLDGLAVELETGFATEEGVPLPPGVLDIVLRNTAHLYEHREILIPGTEFVAPDLKVDATWWVPRA